MEQKKVFLKCNGNPQEAGIQFELHENVNILRIKEALMEEFQSDLEFLQIYDKNGKELFNTDLCFLQDEEVIYYDLEGNEFDYGTILKQYKIIKKLGEGGYGKVVLAKHLVSKELVAIKYMDISNFMTRASKVNDMFREALAIKKLNHPNIARLYHAFIFRQSIVLIMEYYDGGELRELIEKSTLDEIRARVIFGRVAHAVNYCHAKFTIHRDLKPRNILFQKKGNFRSVRVIDFGIAGTNYGGDKDMCGAGSLRYMAPEILTFASSAADPTIDIWSLGILLFYMLFGETPFGGKNQCEIINNIKHQEITFPPTKLLSIDVKELISGMLAKSPDNRLKMHEIIDHSWFTIPEEGFEEIYRVVEEEERIRLKREEKKIIERLLKDKREKLGIMNKRKMQSSANFRQPSERKVISPPELQSKRKNSRKISGTLAPKSKTPLIPRHSASIMGEQEVLLPINNIKNNVFQSKIQNYHKPHISFGGKPPNKLLEKYIN